MNQTTNDTRSGGSCRCKTAAGFSDDGNLRSSHEHASITQRYIAAPPTSPKISLVIFQRVGVERKVPLSIYKH